MSAGLVLTGAPGTGKSSVLDALGTLLEVQGVAYGALESEELARGSPLLPAEAWLPQLAAVLAMQREAGRRLLLVAATTETDDELAGVVAAIAAETTVVVCLSAPSDVVAARIAAREPDAWPGKEALVSHARALALTMPALEGVDRVIDAAERRPEDLAAEIRDELRARGAFA